MSQSISPIETQPEADDRLKARIAELEQEVSLLRGAQAAMDERLRAAAERAGLLFTGCDTPETLLDEVLGLRSERDAANARAEAAEAQLAIAHKQLRDLSEPGEGEPHNLTLEAELATLRAQAERDAAVVEAAEGLIEHYAMDGELTMWLANDPGAEELCAAAPGAAGGEMATRWRAKHQKAKRQLQYAAQYGFYAPPVSVHYFDDYSRYGQGDDDDDWPDYDEFDDDGGDCFHCGGTGWIDGYEDDPLWFAPGEMERCTSCHGTGLAKDMTIW